MRYERTQKRETHERIVAEAGKLFRAEGYKGAGVDAVMKSAGLTAGGFYAHFKDKDALFAEMLRQALAGSVRSLSQKAAAGMDPIEKLIDSYLSVKHRDNPALGCVLPTLAAEVSRQSKAVRAVFTQATREFLAELAKHLPGQTRGEREQQAITILTGLAGGMLLARAVDDDQLSERIMRSMRKSLRTAITNSNPKPPRKRKNDRIPSPVL